MESEEQKLLLEEDAGYQKQYQRVRWWVEHRQLLKRIGIGIVIAIEAVLLVYVLWIFTDTYLLSYQEDQQKVAEMVAYGQADLHAYTVSQAANDLVLESARVFSIGDERYDLFAFVTNPNTDWWADFTYQFTDATGGVHTGESFILPSEEKPIVEFSIESETALRTVAVEITDIDWHRVDHHAVGDLDEWLGDRARIEITDEAFDPAFALSEDQTIGRVTFTVKNEGAYSFYDPIFYLLLYRGSTVVGVNKTTVSKLETGETEDVVVNWFGTLPSVSKIEVIPELNLFDPDVYVELEGKQSLDSRLYY